MKSKVIAGLLAFFLGGLGAHKFYLGHPGLGIAYLAAAVIGAITSLFVVGFIILMALGVICLVEAIIYFTKSDEDFQRIYVQERKAFF